MEKEKKIEKELSKIQYRHNNEIQAMELKIENHKNQLLRERGNKIYEMELKFKNKERDLDRKQKADLAFFASCNDRACCCRRGSFHRIRTSGRTGGAGGDAMLPDGTDAGD